MKPMIDFMKHMAHMPRPVVIWLVVLASVNMASLLFFSHIEAKVVFAAMMLGAMLQTAIFSKFGFVRLLGLGHFHWFPMFAWIYTRLDLIQTDSSFYTYIIILSVINGISLVIDVIDVFRFFAGERKPYVSLD